MNWIQHPVKLEGTLVKLVPLELSHIPELIAVGSNPQIWEFVSINGADASTLSAHLNSAIALRTTGDQYPLTIIEQKTGRLIGSTMFHTITPQHRKLEIGWTWYHPSVWKTGCNTECKFLLLRYCFQVLHTNRVQFKAYEKNTRSCNALLGIGAVKEGVLRKERIRTTGEAQNTVMFSIIDSEWEAVKAHLLRKMDRQQD
jgi:N-acetyltransferase